MVLVVVIIIVMALAALLVEIDIGMVQHTDGSSTSFIGTHSLDGDLVLTLGQIKDALAETVVVESLLGGSSKDLFILESVHLGSHTQRLAIVKDFKDIATVLEIGYLDTGIVLDIDVERLHGNGLLALPAESDKFVGQCGRSSSSSALIDKVDRVEVSIL
ncbi:hypothetical protein FB192DRAFT_1379965 [Mucor lusitanicus]|uniref:Uncharacterized protein n=1 Tax=Mucor circinelloides f. lusitanicus TaxID=29924 RepID=A0A8H4BIQ2_MUCCL|nr:hypothetical protein FB192DRAFT_1379965 [Mucor lusitanicus]